MEWILSRYQASANTLLAALLGLSGCLQTGTSDDNASVEQFSFGSDLGVGLGSPVTTNSTTGRSDDYHPTCVSSSAASDMSYTWTAPSTGSYTFSTLGSSFDTVLEVRQYNTGVSLGCNDDSAGTLQSTVSASLSAGQTVLVVVDGYSSSTGPFQLNIGSSGGGARHYTCGYALPGYGCDNGRDHRFVVAADLTAAIPACRAAQPATEPDFCYVIDGDGGTASDVSECSAASASWRSGNSCCNFMGTLSCP
jgi:hypothetical protein